MSARHAARKLVVDPDARSGPTLPDMSTHRYQVKELARLARVTVRTLHHYDRIGLLVAAERTEAGYRVYHDRDLVRLQQILVHRQLGLSLEQIRRVLDDPEMELRDVLVGQRDELQRRVRKVKAMLRSVEAAIAAMEGEREMNAEEMFEGFDPSQYEDEAATRWGHTEAYAESARRTAEYTNEDWARMKEEGDGILGALANRLAAGEPTGSEGSMDLAEDHRLHIDRWFYPCSHEAHRGLSAMYTADPRFSATFEAFGSGLAAYLAEAIAANSRRCGGR